MAKQRRANTAGGWNDVSQGGRAPFVVWKKTGQTVEGIVGNHNSYVYEKKKHKSMEVIDTTSGETVALTDNHALQPLIDLAKKGDRVRVVFGGRIKLKGKKTLLQFKKIQHKPA